MRNEFSTPIVFQRLPVLDAEACLEFCHSGRGWFEIELRVSCHIFPNLI